jgi:hypothetical protein
MNASWMTAGQGNDSERQRARRAIIPDLLDKSHMDLDLALEYCLEYEIETEVALLCFVEKLILARPTSPGDVRWKVSMNRVATQLVERKMIRCLKKTLTQIHVLDYEKIFFVCSWLITALTDLHDDDGNDHSGGYVNQSIIADDASSSGIAAEIENYERYIEIAKFLEKLRFPIESTSLLLKAAVTYEGECTYVCT